MPPDNASTKGGGMMSLYANLLGPDADASATPGTISRAPVVFKQGENDAQSDESAAKKQQLNPASLRFQPTKRPQLAAQKTKPKPALPKAIQPNASQPSAPASASAPIKSTLADWAAEDDDYGYVGEKRQRGGRKKRKKNHEPHEIPQNWDDIYDPSRPNNYEEYRHSDEKILEVREWKDRLYAHRMRRSPSRDSDSDDYDRPMNRQFAPPGSFAPPPNLNDVSPPPAPGPDSSGEDAFSRRARMSQRENNDTDMPDITSVPPPPPNEPPAPPSIPIGDDVYERRFQQTNQPPPPDQIPPPPPPPPPSRLDAFQPSSATISRAPVRYTLPPPPPDIPASEAELEEVLAKEQPADAQTENDGEDSNDAPRSLRPGQKGFAERLLSKYGWTKGSGLGATGSGIAKPLQVKVEKRKKRPDAEGGGFVTPGGRGTIIGGKRKGEDTGKFGPMSEVIILRGMLDGMDLEAELESGDLMQDIGEECNEKYGSVERVYIARDAGMPIPVFVKFTSPLSALRAVNALEGRIFNGNAITARFFNTEKFEEGVYVE